MGINTSFFTRSQENDLGAQVQILGPTAPPPPIPPLHLLPIKEITFKPLIPAGYFSNPPLFSAKVPSMPQVNLLLLNPLPPLQLDPIQLMAPIPEETMIQKMLSFIPIIGSYFNNR